MSEWDEIYKGDAEALRRLEADKDRVLAIRSDPGLRKMVQRVGYQAIIERGFDPMDPAAQPVYEAICDAGIALYLTGLAHGEIYEGRIRAESDSLTREVTEVAIEAESGE